MRDKISNRISVITFSFLVVVLLLLFSTMAVLVFAMPQGSKVDTENHDNQDYPAKIDKIDKSDKSDKSDSSFNQVVESPELNDLSWDQDIYINKYYDYLTTRNRPENVVDDYLGEILNNVDTEKELEIIIQFMDVFTENDRDYLERLGIELIHEFESLPAVFAKANKLGVEHLSGSPRIFWIEYNEPLKFHMDKSLMVVNATKTWNTIIEDERGNELQPIDGNGVTVVVLDTGIDAGHPDLDYKEKTTQNLKSDFGLGPWIEMENSDTSYGHGTHCAGTVAGNGDASAGARRGVAPGANLIGLSIGDFGVNLANAVGGYEWVYANTKPFTGSSEDPNIRVVSNSWGPSADKFDPNDVISQFIERCTVEKNVVSVFAAGNSGENNHDGHTVETNPYGSTPMSIGVAATERHGQGMAYFSSRGEAGLNETWPDVAAPGVRIWSAAARRTYISIMKNIQDWQDLDPYYFAISGTSMATPHVAGAVALLFQACPSLKLSSQHDDFSGRDNESYSGLEDDWWESPTTLVHEAELILEASAGYIEPMADNGVPGNYTYGWTGGRSDLAQGYGLMNVERAVAIALTLNELRSRDFNNDGKPDYPNATVYQAIKQHEDIMDTKRIVGANDKLTSHWKGDWTKFHNQTTSPNLALSTDQSHYVFVPEGASRLVVNLQYTPIQTTDGLISTAGIQLVLDYDGDGSNDWTGSMLPRDQPDEISLTSGGFSSNLGKLWNFNIEGYGFGLPNSPPGNFIGESYYEITVEYTVDLEIIFDSFNGELINANFSGFNPNDPQISNLKLSKRSQMPDAEGINLYTPIFNLQNVKPIPKQPKPKAEREIETPWYIWLLLALAILIMIILFYRKYQKNKKDEIE
jgi:serine protease AprX